MNFLVSVIIPVYNCENYIEKAIKSALLQPEVSEIVVVNDGSTDGTQYKLEKLQKQSTRVKVYHHKNHINKGRSESRNLAIKKSLGNYIAFLDADDFYLPHRFSSDRKIFQENNNADGVYNAIGVHFYRKSLKLEEDQLKLTTVTNKIEPENLFNSLMSGKQGHFSIDGLTIKKSVIKSIGLFNEDLIVSEDTELIYKMALKCNLLTGIIDYPVAIRGIHENNVTGRVCLYKHYEIKMYESLYFWSSMEKLDLKIIERFLERIWIIKYKEGNSIFNDCSYWFYLVIRSPYILISYLTVKYFPLVRKRKKLFKNV